MEENTVIKIEKGIQSAKVTIMTNVPKRQGFGTFRLDSDMDKLLAKRYFERKTVQEARSEAFKNAICERFIFVVKDKPKSEASLFMDAYFRSKLDGKTKGKYHKSNYQRRQKKREQVVRELVSNNFIPNGAIFCTVTFDPARNTADNLALCKTSFKRFIARFNRRYENLKYVSTFSRQNNGNWHFHFLANLSSMQCAELSDIWQNGIVDVKNVSTAQELIHHTNYLIKNMREIVNESEAQKGYLCSKGLTRNTILRSWRPEESEQCVECFEQLSKEDKKRLLYNAERDVGAIVAYEYSHGIQENFCLQRDLIGCTEKPNVIEKIKSTTAAVRVYLDSQQSQFVIATKRKI